MSRARGMSYALLLSLAVHVALAVVLLRRAADRACPAAPGAVTPVPVEVVSSASAGGAGGSGPALPNGPRGRPRARVVPAGQRVDGPERSHAEPEPGDPSAAGGEQGSAPGDGVPHGPPGGGSPGGPPGPPGSGSSAGTFPALQAKLERSAERCYPPQAVRFHARGTVALSFCVTAAGQPSALRVVASSGAPILDRAALECVVPGAAPLPARGGCYTVPVRFGGPAAQ